MTRVLVVNHDIDLADQEVDSLRRRGYDVTECLGPIGAHALVAEGARLRADGRALTTEQLDVANHLDAGRLIVPLVPNPHLDPTAYADTLLLLIAIWVVRWYANYFQQVGAAAGF